MEQMTGYLKFLKNYYKGSLKTRIKKASNFEDNDFKDLGILTPKIGTSNLGDKIIYDSVYSIVRELFPNDFITEFPTQLHTTFDAQRLMREKDLLFLAGSNLLSSNLETRHQWKIHSGHKKFLQNKVVLFGCGWWQYQGDINSYTKDIYKSVFNNEVIHSARDRYTVDKLKSIGINNVVNTTCPTLWSVTPDKCAEIPKNKSENVITTLTSYKKDAKLDHKMLKLLSKNYQKVFLWIQGMGDFHYLNKINNGIDNVELLPPTIEAYSDTLQRPSIDYVGTRLHAGIKALKKGVRTLILAVDNRAYEIGKDVNLNVIRRENVEEIPALINKYYETKIELPFKQIEQFKNSLKNKQ